MNRLEAIDLIISHIPSEDIIIHANGAISRESYFCGDRRRNFYLLGSMGLASSVGLGFALSKPQLNVFVLDGDGNILMGMGNLAMIGALKPRNFIHIILDNEVYGTTGDQPTLSPEINLDKIALASGYKTSQRVSLQSEFDEAFTRVSTRPGPHFILFKVNTQVSRECFRIPFSAHQMKERFLNSF
jgi:sulfopyruvate decarboxylase subunit beta